MISNAIYSLKGEIDDFANSRRTDEDKKRFMEGLRGYIRSQQKDTAMKILRRIYNNDIAALRHDAATGEREKILTLIDEDATVEDYERKKMFGILYPMLKAEFEDFMRMWGC